MVKVTFIEPSGREVAVEVPDGYTLMQAARSDGIEGIEAECGGSCACGTCHVYVEGEAAARLPPLGETETMTLESVAAERRPNSRLSCQIQSAPSLDGLIVRVAPSQN
jgi:2Fe-2S ferredoxin